MKYIERHPRLSAVVLLIGSSALLYPAIAYLADIAKPIDRNTQARIEAHCAETVEATRNTDERKRLYIACMDSTWQTVQRLLTSRKYDKQGGHEGGGNWGGPGVSRYW
ncbi:MAG: hypothetical protein EPN31_09560 [Castellaniella sp.]|uniref:hypothetical protein n=1 Tax=Castellaniella sp. TaxID=1955812 RepID=UPI00121FBD8B|nr:hypothetical protein [Castellaniella sp.]TAN27912.1 MAG: hypothetical protein EPN31_09560 [Castellaniella sp.]